MPGPGGSQTYVAGPTVPTTNTTADTIAFSENVVPVSGARVREIIHSFTGSNLILTNITRFTYKAGQVPFIDVTTAYVRAWLGWYGKKPEWATANARCTFPLHGYRGWSAPPNQGLRLEVAKNATPGTGTATIHEGLNDSEESQGFMYLLANTFNVPASSARYTIPITQPGVLSGLIVADTADITLLRIYDASGLVADFADFLSFIDSQLLYSGTTVSDPIYWKLPIERLVVSGVTRLEIGTGSGWTDQAFGFHTYIPAAPSK
jgi:hypothetical protein